MYINTNESCYLLLKDDNTIRSCLCYCYLSRKKKYDWIITRWEENEKEEYHEQFSASGQRKLSWLGMAE